MLPFRLYDHYIKLETDAKGLSYSLLYYQSLTKLKEVKRYLVKNLNKGFIKPSQAPYTLPIFFVKKANKSLRFYINFYKLNNLTKKD